jgi:hypothetical protein
MAIRALVIAGVYAGVATAWVYGALNSPGGLNQLGQTGEMYLVTLVVLGLVHLVAGYAGGIAMLALPVILVAVAVPAGDFPASRPEYPIWFGLALVAPVLVALTGVGTAARRFGPLALRQAQQGPPSS